jgi:hypothetical protein
MILKIERIRDSRKVRLRLSGEFRSHHLDQVKAEISRGEPIALDLEQVWAKLFVDGGFAQV